MGQPEWATRADYTPMEWRNRVRAAKIKLDLDRRLGKPTPAWIRELAAEELPELPRPTRRRGTAA